MKLLAMHGDRGWQFYVGVSLFYGTSEEGKKPSQGIELLSAAARRGEINAMRELGSIYSSVAELKNSDLAYQWFFLASHGDREVLSILTKDLETLISAEHRDELQKHAQDLLNNR
jgi:TPR repeat protein